MPSFRGLVARLRQRRNSRKSMTPRIVDSVATSEPGVVKKPAHENNADPDSESFIRVDTTEVLQEYVEDDWGQSQRVTDHETEFPHSSNTPVDIIDNLGPFEKGVVPRLEPRIGEESTTDMIRTQTHDEQSHNSTERALIREYNSLQKSQAEISRKLQGVSRGLLELNPHLSNGIAVAPLQGHFHILAGLPGSPFSDSHRNDVPRNTYLHLIDNLKMALRKLHGTRQDIATAVDDIWEIMVQVDLKNDDNSYLSGKSRSSSSPLVSSWDQGALKLFWCHKSPFWRRNLLKSLKTLQNGATAEPCQEYDFSLAAVREVGKDLLQVLKWLRSQPALTQLIENTSGKSRLQWAVYDDEAPNLLYGLEYAPHYNSGSQRDDSISVGTIAQKRHPSVNGMSIIDGPFDTRSPEVAAIASRFHVSTEATEYDSASCLLVESIKLISSEIAAEEGVRDWDSVSLLQIADRVRGVCDEDVLVLSTDLVLLDYIFKDILRRELHEKVSITFFDIMFSRLDKLLEHLNGMEDNDLPQAKSLKQVIRSAALVKQSWHKRFQGRLSTIDEDRVGVLLENIIFELDPKSGYPVWIPKRNPRIRREEVQLEIGQWWPNISCMYRDGLISSLSVGKECRTSAIPTIPLLNGIEVYDAIAGCLRYTIEGPLKAMILRLQRKVGKTIKLLRGYKLKSLLAPEAGIRYDGKYLLSRYGHEYADPTKGVFRMTLWYEEVVGQAVIGSDALLYKPSMKDDWLLYQTAEDEEMKKSCTALSYAAWKDATERELIDCNEWRSEQASKERNEGELRLPHGGIENSKSDGNAV